MVSKTTDMSSILLAPAKLQYPSGLRGRSATPLSQDDSRRFESDLKLQ